MPQASKPSHRGVGHFIACSTSVQFIAANNAFNNAISFTVNSTTQITAVAPAQPGVLTAAAVIVSNGMQRSA